MTGSGTRDDPWILSTPLGSADEQKPAKDGTVEAWARSPQNRLEALGLAEVEHNPRNNRMRAL